MTALATGSRPSWPARAHLRWLRTPATVRVLVVYALARLFTAAVLAEVARFQPASTWTTEDPGYGGMLGMWDADWYGRIAEEGYPRSVPLGPAGDVQQSQLAFYPLAPLLARLLMTTGLPFTAAGAVVSLVAGAAAACGVHALLLRVLARRAGPAVARRGAWAAAVLFCVSPPSLVFQVPYTEGRPWPCSWRSCCACTRAATARRRWWRSCWA